MQENIFKSIDCETETTNPRLAHPIKRYATDGKNIPRQKNWAETWCTLWVDYGKCIPEVLNYEVRCDDVFLVTYMKSGTTWMQECAWLLLNNLNFEKSKQTPVMVRSPYLESASFVPGSLDMIQTSKNYNSPRLIKSHMPANLLPLKVWENKQKTIYVARNVKDVIVSSYHFMKNINLWRGSNLSEYVEDFLNNQILYTHYWSHVVDFWLMRHESFIFFVTYEEMQRDLAGVLERLCNFLERPQLTKQELEKIVEHLSFDGMKKHENTNMTYLLKKVLPEVQEEFQFMRRGIVGSFKDELSPELIAKIDKWSAEFLGQHGIKEEDIFGHF